MMSSLFGDPKKGVPSLTESIFGTAASSTTAGTSDLFAKKVTTNNSTAKLQQPPRKRPRTGDSGSQQDRHSENNNKAETHEEIIKRRQQQSQRDILDQLTISLEDYYKDNDATNKNKNNNIRHDELNADVRGLMKHHGLVIIRNALSSGEVDTLLTKADATQQSMCALLDAKNIPYHDEMNNHTEGARFQELAVRCQGRMDVRYDPKTDPTMSIAKHNNNGNPVDNQDDNRNNPTKKQMPIPLPLIDTMAASVLHGAEPPELVYAGWIFSFPGSANQPWHQDGSPLFGTAMSGGSLGLLPSYAINVFCGLHDDINESDNDDTASDDDDASGDDDNIQHQHSILSLELGPTEFVVGSHHMAPEDAMAKVDAENNIQSDKRNTESLVVTAVLGKGDILLYDYRICHRGTSNISGAAKEKSKDDTTKNYEKDNDEGVIRKVLYLMYSRPWFREHLNFGDTMLFEDK